MAALGEARFIGGCVRDALLGLPVSDIDIATPHPPDEVTRRLEGAGIRVIPSGIRHGTVTALVGPARFEVTTLRRDLACDGRHAEVAFTDDWQADAARRDFTVNALSCTVTGELFDPFGGINDLAAHKIRFIGNAPDRIREDVLRLLRHYRFFARYGGAEPDAEALAACRTLAPLLAGLSGERVRAELFRLLTGPRPAAVWGLIDRQGIAAHLLPVATGGDRLTALMALEDGLGLTGAERAVPRLTALVEGVAAASAVAERLRLSTAERARLLALTGPVLNLGAGAAGLRRPLATLADGALFRDLALLAAASGAGEPALAPVWTVLAEWGERPFPLGGRDAVAAGMMPGPEVGRLLAAVRDWWADRAFVPDADACRDELVRRIDEGVSPRSR